VLGWIQIAEIVLVILFIILLVGGILASHPTVNTQ
jgi:hypothetical protein